MCNYINVIKMELLGKMIEVTIKKLWHGHASLRSNWIKYGIDKGGLLVKYKAESMRVSTDVLKKLLQSKPSQYITSKYGGIYGLHDLLWIPKDERQNELFKGEENG